MLNREKVIKGLQCIIDGNVRCESCGYAIDKHGHHSCQQNCASDAIALLKEQEAVVRCKDCKHLFGGEHTKNCCDVLMEKAGWLKEISISPDWFCADGERR